MGKNDLTNMRKESRLLTLTLFTYWITFVALSFFEWIHFSIFLIVLNIGIIIFCLIKSHGQHTIKLIFSLIFALVLLIFQFIFAIFQLS